MALLLSACGGNPFLPDGNGTGNGPPGTSGGNKDANDPIQRTEAVTATGNGYAVGIALNAEDDTFVVDGLPFDGDNIYARGTTVSELGPFQVYEGDDTYADTVTGANIDQDLFRAIYGESESGKTSFAIVRTGSYTSYGYGGFLYKRNGKVTLPTSGAAGYVGDYAGLRDFNGVAGLEYTIGTMTMAIDFEDFNTGAAIQGDITNRRIYGLNSEDITDSVIAAIETEFNVSLNNEMPTLSFFVGNALKASGEASGAISSRAGSNPLEKGTYYALIADTDEINAGEVVGVIVIESNDYRPEFEGVKVRETGGFILLRSTDN